MSNCFSYLTGVLRALKYQLYWPSLTSCILLVFLELSLKIKPHHPTHPVPKHQRYSSKVPHPYLSSVFRRKGAQSESLSAQQTHFSILNPSILWSQGFPPEIPAPGKPNTAQKGSQILFFSSVFFPLDLLVAHTVTKSKNTQGSKSQTGRDLRDGRLIMSLLYQPHTCRSPLLSFL